VTLAIAVVLLGKPGFAGFDLALGFALNGAGVSLGLAMPLCSTRCSSTMDQEAGKSGSAVARS